MAKKATETKAETAKTATQTINKSEAVRRAIAAGKTMPGDGVAYIKEAFGIDIAPNHFSSIKSTAGGPQKTARRPGRPKGSTNKSQTEAVVAVVPTAPRVPQKTARRPGRPKGSTNKSKTEAV